MQESLQTTALKNFKEQYPMVTSADLQTFLLGMQAMERVQESCILKGIATQLLGLSVPTIDELNKMLKGFGFVVIKSILDEEITTVSQKICDQQSLINDIKETLAHNDMDSVVSWINDREEEINL